ncbi:HEPN domain-containing protein [Bosea sp. TWI1241]|uniref:HEPN domain-containing protein n=1 Tax=Bosea sp. TWI1241 TaxID=3148904 RepID=UPI003209EA0D
MSKMEDAIAFRTLKRPLMTLWSVDGIQAYGSLIWSDEKPILTLVMEVSEQDTREFENADLPLLRATRPPKQTTISGISPKFGNITLDGCARYNVRLSHNYSSGRAIYELDFVPTTIWMGAPKDRVDGRVVSVVASDTRLAGFFGSPGLKTFRSFGSKAENAFKELGNPDTIWAVYGPEQIKIQLGATGWLLNVFTNSVEGSSATAGYSLNSTVDITFKSPEPVSVSEASRHLDRFEDILSTFSIEAFTFQFECYHTEGFESIALVWRLGERRSLFRSPMRHQILIDLSDPETLEAVCKQWFLASPTVVLSRWLFVRALRETDDGLARFVAVAQAFEVLGRELGPRDAMPKSRLKQAIALIQQALTGPFEDGFVNRVVGLIQSSNKASYRDVLHHMLGGVVERLHLGSDDDIKGFSKLVSDTRNAVIHMTDNDKGKLDAAFARVNKLSLRLCFWYAVLQADQMQLIIPDIRTFLFNNRNARHGLPNEVLERN